MVIRVESFSEVGGHAQNEDAFCVQPHPQAADCCVCILADGQGGRSGGGPAARLACESVMHDAVDCEPKRLLEQLMWPQLLRRADMAVMNDPITGFTTLIGLCAFNGRIAGASSGDSAVLLVYEGKVTDLSRHQHKNPPVGSGMAVAIPFAATVEPPWKVVVMSDGVWKYVGWDRVTQIASNEHGTQLLNSLQLAARLPVSGQFQDDFTVVLMEA